MIMRMITTVTTVIMCIAVKTCMILTTITTAIITIMIIAINMLRAEGCLWIAVPIRPA